MKLNAVPQFQGSVTDRSQKMPEGCLALAELASEVLGVPVHKIPQSQNTSPLEDGVANRAVLTGYNLEAQREAVADVEEPIMAIGGDCGVEFVPR